MLEFDLFPVSKFKYPKMRKFTLKKIFLDQHTKLWKFHLFPISTF